MSNENQHVRKPWIATSLSLVCTGLGHIYCGRVGRGLILYSLTLLFGPILVGTACMANSTPMLIAFLASLAGLLILVVWSVRDAAVLARSLANTHFELREYNRPAVYALLTSTGLSYGVGLALFVRATVFEAFIIPSASMSPTLVPGDRVLVSKIGMSTETLQRGELVVFRNPINRRQNFVKRIIGLPGETIEIKSGEVLINGQALERYEIAQTTDAPRRGRRFLEKAGTHEYTLMFDNVDPSVSQPPVTVAPDAYFVLGDHRDMSLDSREVGSIPHGLMIGVVKYIYLPGDSWSRFGSIR
jgi:signal peptidase I